MIDTLLKRKSVRTYTEENITEKVYSEKENPERISKTFIN